MDQFNDMFKKVIEAQQARVAAQLVAGVQAAHYQALTAAGLEPAVAMEITVRTSETLMATTGSIVEVVAKNAPTIVSAIEQIMNTEVRGPR